MSVCNLSAALSDRRASLQLLLHAQLVCVSALLLPAVHCTGVQTRIAPAEPAQQYWDASPHSTITKGLLNWYNPSGQFVQNCKEPTQCTLTAEEHVLSADHLVLIVLAGQDLQRGLDDASTQPHHKVQCGIWTTDKCQK